MTQLRAPAWLGLLDFKVLLLETPDGTPKAQFTENNGYRWDSQKQEGDRQQSVLSIQRSTLSEIQLLKTDC